MSFDVLHALHKTGGMRLIKKNKTDKRGHQFSEMAQGMKIIKMPPANKMELHTIMTTGFIFFLALFFLKKTSHN